MKNKLKNMKKISSKFFLENKMFKREFRKQIRLLLIITFGFTIAFTWRQTVFDISLKIIKIFLHIQDNAILSILASLLITIICLILIYFTSYLLRDSYDNY